MTNEKTTVLTLNASRFREQLKHLTPFMSREETRYYLNGFYLTYDGTDLLAIATNGHILYEATVSYEGGGEPFKGICPRSAVEALCKMLKRSRGALILTVTHGDRVRFTFDDLDCQLTVKTLDGTFPDYKSVIPEPKVEKQVNHARFNVDYLLAVAQAFPGEPVNVFCDGKVISGCEPHLITSTTMPGVRCVVMPIRTVE